MSRCSNRLRKHAYVGFSGHNKIQHCSAYDIRKSYPDRAQKLISLSMSQHLSTCDISYKSTHAFLSNLANRQTDRQMRANTFTSSFVPGKIVNSIWEIQTITECKSTLYFRNKYPIFCHYFFLPVCSQTSVNKTTTEILSVSLVNTWVYRYHQQ